MNILSIVLVIGAAIMGIVIGMMIVKASHKNNVEINDDSDYEKADEISELKQALKEKEDECSELKARFFAINPQETSSKDNDDLIKEIVKAESEIKELKNSIKDLETKLSTQTENFEKAKKDLKKANDDIEDLEDDLDEQKMKTKKIEAEKNEQIGVLEKKNKQISDELTETKSELDEANNEIKLKSESLSFVQEVMNAKPADNKSYSDKIKKIEDIYNYISDDFATFIETNIVGIKNSDIWKRCLSSEQNSSLSEWREITSKHWVCNKTKIALVGEFSAGKTSIVNRLLSQDDPNVPLLPVSTQATTAIPTYISGGPTTTYCFYTPDNKLKNISKATFSKVNKEVLDQVQGVSALIKYFVMTYKNPNLNGMSILDTPGFNSNDSEDATRTLSVINECDALFWVVDVNTGTINRSSLNLIKKELKKPLYVIINKTDTKASSEIDKVENLIKSTFEKEGLSPQKYLRFSKKEPLDSIMNVVKSISRSNDAENYHLTMNYFIQDCVSQFKEDVSQKNRQHSSARKRLEKLTASFEDTLDSMACKCEAACGIPHWETHFFRSDKYEMSASEGSELLGLLNTISDDDVPSVRQAFNENSEASKQLRKTYEDLKDSKTTLNEMLQHQQKINRLFNELNNM